MLEPFNEYGDDEMVYNKEDGKIMAGGYLVNSLLLNQGEPVSYSTDDFLTGGKKTHKADKANMAYIADKFSDRFKHLAIPAGFLYAAKKPHHNHYNKKNTVDTVVNDDLYEKLLKLAQESNTKTESISTSTTKKKPTRRKKHKNIAKHKTKRTI